MINELTLKGITWHFNTPLAPHHGGLWEAAVRSFKHHLFTTIGTSLYTFEELYTILVRIEAILNSRPLVAPTDDPTDLTVLTPGHLICGEQIIRPLGPTIQEVSADNHTAWAKIRHLELLFWQRWSKEYLETLQGRTKWATTERGAEVGDLVVVKDQNMPPGQWKRGRITEIFPGKDGVVRSVRLQTMGGREYHRPIVKLVFLPVDKDAGQHLESTETVAKPLT